MQRATTNESAIWYVPTTDAEYTLPVVKRGGETPCVYFVGPYKPIMCGIADYTSFITGKWLCGRWGVLSFDLDRYGVPIITDDGMPTGRIWYGIPSRSEYSASAIAGGLNEFSAKKGDCVLWFQHEFGIWPGSFKFVAMLKNLDMPKVVTFHTLHFESGETSSGLCRRQYQLLRILLPHVDAITVFSHGVYRAVASAFPEYSDKVHVIKHGVHSYPEINRLSRKEAKEKLNDYLLYESGLDRETKEALHNQRVFIDPNIVVVGQSGFLSPSKSSELLYPAGDRLQKAIPHRRIVAVRIGSPRDESQRIYAEQLRRRHSGGGKFLLETWLPQHILPLAQRAFDINFYWPRECSQSGVLAHALGAGAIVAGRDLEGVGETLKEAGELADTDFRRLLLKMRELILRPELTGRVEERALNYAAEFSWENQARRHYELAEYLSSPIPIQTVPNLPVSMDVTDATTYSTN